MRPGAFSQEGFLGPKESLRQVLDRDARTLAELGITASALGARLQDLLVQALTSGESIARVDIYRVQLRRYKGPQLCPFAPRPFDAPCPGPGDPRLASIDWDITHTRKRIRMTGPGLISHLIAAHGFFEGVQSPYRVEPRALAQLMGMSRTEG